MKVDRGPSDIDYEEGFIERGKLLGQLNTETKAMKTQLVHAGLGNIYERLRHVLDQWERENTADSTLKERKEKKWRNRPPRKNANALVSAD